MADVKDRVLRAHALLRRHPLMADTALAALLAASALISVKALYDESRAFDPVFRPPPTWEVVVSMLAMTVPLALRRRAPGAVVVAVTAAFIVGRVVVEVPESSISLLAGSLAVYSAALHGARPVRTLVVPLSLAAILGEVVRELFFIGPAGDLQPLTQAFFLVYNVVVLALPWLLGAVIRSLRERERELGERAAELQQEREENARQAVFAERVRISRELHDVVAHHVSLMGVQAGAARLVMERQPAKAAEALSSIEQSSRQAVVDLDRLLGFLRRTDAGNDLGPQPGLAQLDDLVAQSGREDLAVELVVQGSRRPLSSTLDVSAYRIIQEALTNTRKHAAASNASVRVVYGETMLELEVVDDGKADSLADGNGRGGGHGLIGMRERATLHGGHLRAGPRPGGGFGVHATFPLGEAAP